jgi:hypothetical protein
MTDEEREQMITLAILGAQEAIVERWTYEQIVDVFVSVHRAPGERELWFAANERGRRERRTRMGGA